MPRKNSIKTYSENTIYHLYNRGIDKKDIFRDDQDYQSFIFLLQRYLSSTPKNQPFIKDKSLYGQITLLAFCLMPDHFHLLVKQITNTAIASLAKKVCTNYAMYFNKKYKRSGSLFDGRYRAVVVDNPEQLLHLSRYIHLNPHLSGLFTVLEYEYSSYPYFLGNKKADWINPQIILDYFNRNKIGFTYQEFISRYIKEESALDQSLVLEEAEESGA